MALSLTNGGKAYLNLHFQDGSGVIDGKKWDVTNEDLETLEIGGLVRVDGTTLDYKGKLQIKVLGLYKVDPNDADLEGFLLQSPIPVETLIAKFKKHYASVKNEDCKLILKEIFTRMSFIMVFFIILFQCVILLIFFALIILNLIEIY